MNKLKFLSVVLFFATLAVFVGACKEDPKKDPEVEGTKAGQETCNCVETVEGPNLPNPPAGVNPLEPDLTDPATLAWLGAVENAYNAYFGELGGCTAQVASRYEEFYSFDYEAYDPTSPLGFFSCFNFKDTKFQAAFMAAAGVCADAFPSF